LFDYAFLHCEERKVDKAGCISFTGKKYEVSLPFIGCKGAYPGRASIMLHLSVYFAAAIL